MFGADARLGDLAVTSQQHEAGGGGVHGARHPWRLRDGGDELTGCQRADPLVVAQQNRSHRNGFDDRAGHTPPAQPLHGHHQIDRMGVDAVELLRDHQRRHTQVGQLGPHLTGGCGVAVSPRPHGGRQVGGTECRVDARREVALLFVDLKIHVDLLSGQAQQPLGDDIALNLVGTGIDRAAQRKEQAVGDGVGDLAVGSAQVQRGLM